MIAHTQCGTGGRVVCSVTLHSGVNVVSSKQSGCLLRLLLVVESEGGGSVGILLSTWVGAVVTSLLDSVGWRGGPLGAGRSSKELL